MDEELQGLQYPHFSDAVGADEVEEPTVTVRLDPAETIPVVWGASEVTVTGFERVMPEQSSAGERAKAVRAGERNPYTRLSDDAWHAVARAVVHPEALAGQLRLQQAGSAASMLVEEHVDGATLRSVHARVWLTELFPGLQPRTGQEHLPTADPDVLGVLDGESPQAAVRYRYRDRSHLRDHILQTFEATLRINRYDESILARRVTRAVIAHPVVFEFEDGTEPVHALAVRDGITRLASAWKVLAGASASSVEVAQQAVRLLLAERPQRRGAAERPLSQRMAQGREDVLAELRGEFLKGVAGEQPSARAIQIGQASVLPAQIAVGVEAHRGGSLRGADLFDDAVRSILASVHVEFKAWDPSAQNVEVGTRALKRVVQTGVDDWETDELQGLYDLVVGRKSFSSTPDVFRDDRIPGTPLWRAVYIVHSLTRESLFEPLKRYAKEIKGDKRMGDKGFAGLLGPMVDLPWRAAKQRVLKQARNAWQNGGVLCPDVLRDGWVPTPTADFTTLVDRALVGDISARNTLAVAGGVALIADKLIARNVGSAVAANIVPFRADVHKIVGGLSQADNEKGLWILALAANAFDAGRLPLNSLTEKQFEKQHDDTVPGDHYELVSVDLDAPDRVRRDSADAAEPLTQYEVVATSDPQLAAQMEGERRASDNELGREKSIPEQLADERRSFESRLDLTMRSLERLMTLGGESGTLHPMGSYEEWVKLHSRAIDLQNVLYNCAPEDPSEEGDEWPEDGESEEEEE
ncbi:hypothetical protein [Streptomyces sp. UNOC14_S4]|uniref:hypothetical protein n=1 Tax=Streptomyces sp. UNOC14_S4 TaxID=2872340 RepID=UPI001E3E72AB|nr:hypothetical protein [Streptomyces sp. UNOC14_S4]MCC3769892.1 hypothetical protein [Streptomyces sp. UNOC14_S4]